jgi:hypothetical protein
MNYINYEELHATKYRTRQIMRYLFVSGYTTISPFPWIGRGGQTEYSPQSPDLNPRDLFLWGWTKDEARRSKPRNRINWNSRYIRCCSSWFFKEKLRLCIFYVALNDCTWASEWCKNCRNYNIPFKRFSQPILTFTFLLPFRYLTPKPNHIYAFYIKDDPLTFAFAILSMDESWRQSGNQEDQGDKETCVIGELNGSATNRETQKSRTQTSSTSP